jgi:formylglycine-generating enzyme required for sulfatase activity
MIRARFSLAVLAFAWLFPALARAEAPAALDVDLGGGVKLALVLVPKGSFDQGSPPTEAGRSEDERSHRVTLSNDVYIGKVPVTRGQFARFASAAGYRTEAEKGTSGGSGWDGTALVQRRDFTWKSPGFDQTDEHPVTIVTYDDALAFTAWLARTTGRDFTLPTEAQWEYAYRAGTKGPYYGAASDAEALGLGWFKANAGNGTRPVGQKKANGFGLHDMAGDVYEWCLDWYAPYAAGPAQDPVATTPDASDKPRRVLRGGSWLKDAKSGRAAARYRNAPGSRNADNGFRVVAGTSVVAVMPIVPPPSTPPEPLTSPRSSDRSSESTGAASCLGTGACLGTIAFFGWLLVLIFRKKKPTTPTSPSISPLNHRLARDGFWLDAPGHLVGSLVSYRYSTADGSLHDGQVRLEGAPTGQYVYTGHAPATMLALQLLGAASSPFRQGQSSRSSQHQGHAVSHSADDTAFRGYPSAY